MSIDPLVDTDDDKNRNFVTALARGLDILRCYRPGETELSNADLAERTKLPKATVSRLTYTLVKLGYLIADPRRSTYRLGVGVLQLGFGVLSGLDISARAEPEMQALRDGPNSYVTVALGERHQLDAVYVAVERSREDVALTMRIGSRLPLFFSAVGRAILVGLPEDVRESIEHEADAIDPEGQEARAASLARAIDEYEAHGFCSSYGAWRPDVNGIAVYLKSLDGSRVYGLNVGGPSFHVKPKQLEKVYAPLLSAAAARLGFSA